MFTLTHAAQTINRITEKKHKINPEQKRAPWTTQSATDTLQNVSIVDHMFE